MKWTHKLIDKWNPQLSGNLDKRDNLHKKKTLKTGQLSANTILERDYYPTFQALMILSKK
jgi:hypothetical protein